MKRIRLAVSAIVLATLAACGGGGDGNQAPAVQYSQMVVFGDSLSDVGTYGGTSSGTPYGVGLVGGGKYTINGSGPRNWTELVAAQLNLPAPCAAETGLSSSGPLAAFFTATTDHTDCYDYAQGGSRVTNPIGVANAALLSLSPPNTQGYLGQLTVPLSTQIQHHLTAVGGSFSGNELVMVLGGANDVFMNLGQFSADVTTYVTGGATLDQAKALASNNALTAMTTAATDLVGYIKTQMVAKGAKRIAVMTIPDISVTPYIAGLDVSNPGTASLVNLMVRTFNTVLTQGLANTDGVMIVDAYTASQEEHSDPAHYGLTNVTTPACNLTSPSPNVTGSSLTCTESTLIGGDVSTYLFADGVHPTPYGYKLFAQLVSAKLAARGWL